MALQIDYEPEGFIERLGAITNLGHVLANCARRTLGRPRRIDLPCQSDSGSPGRTVNWLRRVWTAASRRRPIDRPPNAECPICGAPVAVAPTSWVSGGQLGPVASPATPEEKIAVCPQYDTAGSTVLRRAWWMDTFSENYSWIRVLDGNGSGSIAAVAQGIDAAHQANADIINLSAGVPASDPEIRAAIERAGDAGAVVVIAAGNEARNLDRDPAWLVEELTEVVYRRFAFQRGVTCGSRSQLGLPA